MVDLDLLRLCIEYLDLRERRRPKDDRRLAGLHRLFAEPVPAPGERTKRQHSRVEIEIPVELIVPSGRIAARILEIGGGGMRLRLERGLSHIPKAIVLAKDDERGFTYKFPCEVAWSRGKLAGLRFVGVAIRTPL